ncbi:MAG: tetratricopeptide repeat protein [Planctomycetaceae bacterium]|nr:tetratricopeptide repeat protein [Planctomycetaceae bacterium]
MTQPIETSHLVRWAAACLFAALLSSGCAHTATVTAWTPAEIDTAGIRRVSVMSLDGDQGEETTRKLTASLSGDKHYTVVDRFDLQEIQWTAGVTDRTGLLSLDKLNAARESDVDTLIVGEILESSCHDSPIDSNEQDRAEEPLSESGISQTTGQALMRDATVSIAFRLIDVENGEILASKEISHAYHGKVVIGQPGTHTHREVLDQLASQCVDEFSEMLAPRKLEQEVTLAKPAIFVSGYSFVWNGNEFARRECWDEAIIAWERAIAINPANDAALFNLSIAYAQQQNFAQAERMAIKAVNLRHSPLYESGLDRIRRLMSDFDKSLQQRQDLN